MTDPLRICLIQHSTRSDNMGVGALTEAQIGILRDSAKALRRDLKITVMDWKGSRSPYIGGSDIEIIDIDRRVLLSPSGFFRVARTSDVVIDIGAGDSFSDIYGSPRLLRMFWMKALVHLSGTPLVMAPQTIGPFEKLWTRLLAKLTLRRSALVTSRDQLSADHAERLGCKNVIVTSDVALKLKFDTTRREAAETSRDVGINVSGLLMRGGYSGKNDFGLSLDYPELICGLIEFFQSEGCKVHLVPHVYAENEASSGPEDDTTANAALSERFPDLVIAPRFSSPSEAKNYISTMDFFVGARMHACIAAFSAGVPVVPMAYSRKFEGLFGALGYHRTVDCTSETTEAIEGKIRSAYADRDTLRHEVEESSRLGLELLDKYVIALEDILRKTGRRA